MPTNYFIHDNQTKLYWFEKYGSLWIIDVLYIALLCPLSVVAVFLNILSFKIFSSKGFSKKNLNKYFKVYTINSMVISALFSFNFLVRTPTILEFTNSYTARFIAIKIMFPLFAIIYFYLSILDIVISLERISHFLIILKKLRTCNPYKICFLLFLVSLAMNLTYTFVYYPGSVNVKLANNTNYTIYYNALTSYGKSKIGQLNIIAVYLTRDVFILFVVIVLNILSIVLLRRHLRKKSELLNSNEENISLMKSINTRLTVMVIVMLTISFLEHLIFFITYAYFSIYKNGMISSICNFVSVMGIVIKQISNFVLFYSFNKVFRVKLNRILGIF